MIEFSKNHYWGSVLMFITINLLFYYRYLSRISPYVAAAGTLFYLLFVWVSFRRNGFGEWAKLPAWVWWGTMVAFLTGSVFVLEFIPREILKVDRWEVIQVFWDSVLQGNNPYGVRNSVGNYPGPMPVYFLIYYPFYLIGEIGYSMLLALLTWFIVFYRKYSKQAFVMAFVLLGTSAFLYWEIFTRSTVLINACLFCYFFLYLLNTDRLSGTGFWVTALVGGLVFSIRNVFILPLIIWAVYGLKSQQVSARRLLLWGMVFGLVFGMTFLPFLVLWPEEFLEMNPFVIQSSVLIPFGYIVFFMGLSAGLGLLAKSRADVFFYGGCVLFLMITAHVFYWLHRMGIQEAFFGGRSDLSYYMFSVPFLLEIMVRRNQKESGI